MKAWNDDKHWSDRFLPEIKQILGMCLIGEPPREEDEERNTDLIVLRMDAVRIACRVRKHNYFLKYPHEITVRAGRPSGVKTELTKIIEGWGDFLLYGFCDFSETQLSAWKLINLKEFRLWFNRYLIRNQGVMPGIKKHNFDGSSYFYGYNTLEMPSDCVFAQSHHDRQIAS